MKRFVQDHTARTELRFKRFVAFANFCVANSPNMADFKLTNMTFLNTELGRDAHNGLSQTDH